MSVFDAFGGDSSSTTKQQQTATEGGQTVGAATTGAAAAGGAATSFGNIKISKQTQGGSTGKTGGKTPKSNNASTSINPLGVVGGSSGGISNTNGVLSVTNVTTPDDNALNVTGAVSLAAIQTTAALSAQENSLVAEIANQSFQLAGAGLVGSQSQSSQLAQGALAETASIGEGLAGTPVTVSSPVSTTTDWTTFAIIAVIAGVIIYATTKG